MNNKKNSLFAKILIIVLIAVLFFSGTICLISMIQACNAIKTSTRQRMLDIAKCASGSIDGDILNNITEEDKDTEEYQRIYNALAVFRDNIESEYVCGIREEDGRFTLIVDTALNEPAEFGKEVIKTDALIMASKGIAAADEIPYTDGRGSFYGTYSPVFDSNDKVAGIIGIDFSRDWYEGQQREQTRYTIILYLVIFSITLAFAGVIYFYRIKSVTDPNKQITLDTECYHEGSSDAKPEIDGQDEVEEEIRIPEELEGIRGDIIDIDSGIKNSGTAESYIELLKIFYESVDKKTEELNHFFNEGDLRNYTIKVHALKSSARIIGAYDFGEEAQMLENEGKAENMDYIRIHHEPFMDDYSRIRDLLAKVLTGPESELLKPEADNDLMSEVFAEIKEAAADMDCERLDDIFTEMTEYRIPKENWEFFEKLKDASERYEYKTILKLMSQE